MKNAAVVLACLSMVLAAGLLCADDTSFRCGDDLIDAGYTMYQVQNSCGAPDSQQVIGSSDVSGGGASVDPRRPGRGRVAEGGGADVSLNVTEWIYNRDQGIYVLTFVGDKLVKKEYRDLD